MCCRSGIWLHRTARVSTAGTHLDDLSLGIVKFDGIENPFHDLESLDHGRSPQDANCAVSIARVEADSPVTREGTVGTLKAAESDVQLPLSARDDHVEGLPIPEQTRSVSQLLVCVYA